MFMYLIVPIHLDHKVFWTIWIVCIMALIYLCVKKDNISTILLILLFELESIHYDLEH